MESIEIIEGYSEGMTEVDLMVSIDLQDKIIRRIEIIGEAVKNVPEEIRIKRPEVSWKDLAGLRDKCIHMYFGINHRRIWQVVKEDIPKYKEPIQSLIDELRKAEQK